MCKLNIFDPVQNYENLNQQLNLRRNKLNNLRKQGKTFTNNFKRNVISNQLFLQYGEKNNETLKTLNIQVSLAGRMINRRIMGKASFVILQDSGGTIQLYLSSKNLSDSFYNEHFKKWDLGDI
ncbi:MAG: OB-fold nucleic acid binding domain-containing protein, partial [Candidatus Baumannia cicadellinicola]|nr:OB-fold nucleic acid binding domain-containing protein [Candidatus Baumannia cicadellinicola]